MAEEFPAGSGWWDTPRNRYDPGTASSSSSSSSTGLTSLRGFSWLGDASSGRSSMETGGGGPAAFLNATKMHAQGHSSSVLGDGGGLADPSLHMMNLGMPPSQTMDWNGQNLLQDDKGETGFRSVLQENFNTNAPEGHSSHPQIQAGFQIESSSIYGAPSPSTLFQGILGSENQPSTLSYQYSQGYGQNSGDLLPSWSKVPPFLRISPPKHQQQAAAPSHNQLHFSNNAPFWNATAASPAASDIRSTSCYFPSPHSTPFLTTSFEEKSKKPAEGSSNVPRGGAAGTSKKSGGAETAGKRARGETGTASPPFKVRKEKTGDRITVLQQLVSPFGKTDTASVLTEAIDYIKFLHEQVNILSAPYLKSGGTMQHHQNMENRDDPEGPRHDLRSRGLCLVPVSSTFPVTHESAVDFWNPTFGGTYR
ncbi:hypothetical protein MLD38_012695 [Melastoma candidum]|uniref:Uncharacterized protein n=1 Tax=Melastoma candidum TaxID=119954 RepID=A0ACB9R7Q6_9MYRT|nr:hypothetical protein MLD38_012695 [Melastoma candidum]